MSPRLDPKWDRRIGYVLIGNALVGLLLGLVGLCGLWWAEPRIRSGVADAVALADRTVNTTSGLLVGVDSAVATAKENMGLIETTMTDVARTLGTTSKLTSSVATAAGRDVVDVMTETRAGLAGLEQTARLADDTLRLVSALPLIGRRYQPEVSLQASVRRVADSLAPLPKSVTAVQSDLKDASANLSAMQRDVEALSGHLSQIGASLDQLHTATTEYRSIAVDLQRDLDTFRTGFPRALRFATLFGSAVMLWLIVAQLGLFTQGLERLQPRG